MSLDAMKQALEALEFYTRGREFVPKRCEEAIAALRTAIAEAEKRHHCPEWDFLEITKDDPEFEACLCFSQKPDAWVADVGEPPTEEEKQEPVAYMGTDIDGNPNKFRLNPFGGSIPLYTKTTGGEA